MLALKTTSKVSPLLNTALNRYASRPFDYPWGLYRNGIFSRRLLIGESLCVQALDVYRSFFLYHSIASYTVPALRYRYDYPYYMQSSGPSFGIDKCISGTLGFFWNVGSWFFRCARSFLSYCMPIGTLRRLFSLGSKANRPQLQQIEDIQ